MIMKKRIYIQPKMAVVPVHAETIMFPVSPGLDQSTNYNPAPGRKRTPVF